MTEEEKRAIEQLKKLDKIVFYPRYKNYFIDNMGEIDSAIHTILNLVEKLQKENEELNNRDTNRLSEIGELRTKNNYLEENYISKDMIREKYEIEEALSHGEIAYGVIKYREGKAQALKELLEEE